MKKKHQIPFFVERLFRNHTISHSYQINKNNGKINVPIRCFRVSWNQ